MIDYCLGLLARGSVFIMAVRERKFFVGGNWKMNGSKASIDVILENLKEGTISADTGVSWA